MVYLHWTRFAFFQLTSALCITVVGLAGWGLRVGHDNIVFVEKSLPGAKLDITDAIGTGGAVTAAAGVASILCLIMNFLGHFQPHRKETLRTVRLKEGAFAFALILWLGTLIPATYIMANKSGVVTKEGVPANIIASIVKLSGRDLHYKSIVAIKAYVAVGWVAFVSTGINLVLVSLAARHVLKFGPEGEQGELVGHHGSSPAVVSEAGHNSSFEKRGELSEAGASA